MEMYQVRYALEAARLLNFTKAAVACNVSQPALTKAIKVLEAEMGTPLFYREGKRMLLSDFGRSLLPHLHQILQEAAATRTLADNFRLLHKVPIRIGVMSTVGPVRLARFLARFQRSYPGVEVAVSEASGADLISRLEKRGSGPCGSQYAAIPARRLHGARPLHRTLRRDLSTRTPVGQSECHQTQRFVG